MNTYRGKAATTEDFKQAVEKHMAPEMDVEGDRKLDWFFNEYVYGTQIPTYKFDSSFESAPDGTIVLSMNIAQSNVDEKFRMLVPVYLALDDGKIALLGRARMSGNTSASQKVKLKSLKNKPRRAMINPFDDVLATAN